MTTSRARRPRPARLTAGLAATALFSAGLACHGAASAADTAAFPVALAYTPTDLVATADEAYAVGASTEGEYDEYWTFVPENGYVTAVGGGEQLALGWGATPTAVSATANGETLHVIGSQWVAGEGDVPDSTQQVLWTVDTERMEVSGRRTLESAQPYTVATGADGSALVGVTRMDGPAEEQASHGAVLDLGDDSSVDLGANVQPTAMGTVDIDDRGHVFVASSTWQDDGQAVATLRVATSEGAGEELTLGPDGDPHEGVIDLAVDDLNDTVYVVTMQDDPEGGPQQYGLTVVSPGGDTFVPLADPVFSVAVSPDGKTVYLPGNGVSAYAADALASYTEDDPAPATYLDRWVYDAVTAPSGRLYVLTESNAVHALEAPGTVQALAAAASDWDPGTAMVSWQEPTTLGGASPDSLGYVVTVQDQAGGEQRVERAYTTEHEVSGLEAGHTYTIGVAASTGAFTSTAQTTSFAVPEALAGPTSLTVRGDLRVGSALSVAFEGAWPSGTKLSYQWGWSSGYAGGELRGQTGPTLTLTPAHLGRTISVVVTGTKEGARAELHGWTGWKVVAGRLAGPAPKVTGTAKAGKTLTAKAGRWPAGTKVTMQWAADGRAIKGATKSRLKLTKALVGKRITVVVKGTRAGYVAASRTSRPTAAVKR